MAACGKVVFATADEAGMALVNAKIRRMLKNDQKRREERYYHCVNCQGYHLTSRP